MLLTFFASGDLSQLAHKMSPFLLNFTLKCTFYSHVYMYIQILSVFQDRGVLGEEVQRFEDLLLQQRELFAEEEIRHSFPKLLAFVLQVMD